MPSDTNTEDEHHFHITSIGGINNTTITMQKSQENRKQEEEVENKHPEDVNKEPDTESTQGDSPKLHESRPTNVQTAIAIGIKTETVPITRDLILSTEALLSAENLAPGEALFLPKSFSEVPAGPHKCYMCTDTFADKNKLKSHIRSHKRKSKIYHCVYCEAKFFRRSHMIEHERIHTGEAPYHCTMCDKSFRRKGHLVKHTRIHTGEKPFACQVCGMAFTIQTSLSKHLRTHTGERPYKCKICGKSFTQDSNLITHRKVHTGEKPFKCDDCGVAYTTRQALQKHVTKKLGFKPYVCELCPRRRYTTQQALRKHLLRKHPESDLCRKKTITKLFDVNEVPLTTDPCLDNNPDESANTAVAPSLLTHKELTAVKTEISDTYTTIDIKHEVV